MNQKEFRRIVGFVAVWLQRLELDQVFDPRKARGKRWQLKQVLSVCLLGLMAGCKSLSDVEQLTATLSRPLRRKFGIGRRVADTTLRDVLCRLSWASLAEALRRAVAVAARAKMLAPEALPFEMLAMDGKVTALPSWDGIYAQQQHPEGQPLPYGLMRTVTATLVTARGKPCISVSPIPASTNEMGHFKKALERACGMHGGVTLVSYDQGANSEENALAVLELGKHYLFRLNDERRHMQQLAMALLATKAVVAETEDVVSNREQQVRRLRLFRLTPSGLPVVYKAELWEHTRTLLCVEWECRKDGQVVAVEQRYYASSLDADALTPEQWLWAARGHWRVETTHQILDVAFAEDSRPWIVNDPNGMLVVAVLRRIAYTLLTLYRSVRQRSEEKRAVTWRALMSRLRDCLIASTEATVAGLRRREMLGTVAITA